LILARDFRQLATGKKCATVSRPGLVADAGKMKKGLNQAETVVDTQAISRIAPLRRTPAAGSEV
jgi:hypothetical protein